MQDLDSTKTSDAQELWAALQQAAHISRLLEELDKNQRVTLTRYRVKGI